MSAYIVQDKTIARKATALERKRAKERALKRVSVGSSVIGTRP